MKNNKTQIYYILLGIGIGLVIGSIVSIISPNVEYVEYTDKEIKQKARELGMYDLDEIIEMNNKLNNDKEKGNEKEQKSTKEQSFEADDTKEVAEIKEKLESEQENDNDIINNDEESTEVNNTETQKEIEKDINEANELEYIEFEVEKGDSSEKVINNLFKANIIYSKEEFTKKVVERKAGRKIHFGKFKIPVEVDYDTLIDILTN